jgi:hypothetical protein
MTDAYTRSVLKSVVAQLAHLAGFGRATNGSLNLLADVLHQCVFISFFCVVAVIVF